MSSETFKVDARRLLCPMPVIRLQQAIENLSAGQHVTVIATDSGVLHDIPAWARVHGHHVLSINTEHREYTITLQVGDSASP